MTQYDNNNRGSIWGNDRKTEENHPDFKGQAEVGGVKYWVSAWKRKPDANPKAPALSFSFQPMDEKPVAVTKEQVVSDDQIPF
jgi:hypothetical protein